MEHLANTEECRRFPATSGTPIVFAARKPFGPARPYVRESGIRPDDPDDSRACWHHRDPADCATFGTELVRDQQARRMTSIGLDVLVWGYARSTLAGIPHRPFLERFEPSRRWMDGATPPMGLARGAVLYHLPVGTAASRGGPTRFRAQREGPDALTAAELFESSRMRRSLCPAEVEWLEAERRARFSYYEVVQTGQRGIVLRDWFRELSGRRDVRLHPGELDVDGLRCGETVFARIVPFRDHNFVNLMQRETSIRAGILDPAAPPKGVWSSGLELKDRTRMVHALFETWERETKRWGKRP